MILKQDMLVCVDVEQHIKTILFRAAAKDEKVAVAFLKYNTCVLSSFSSYIPRSSGYASSIDF